MTEKEQDQRERRWTVAFIAYFIGMILVNTAIFIGIVWVAIHFVRKFW